MNPYGEMNERQAFIIRAFRDARAEGPFRAQSLASLRLQRDVDLDALLASRIVRATGGDPETFYLSLSRTPFLPAAARPASIAALCVAVVVATWLFYELAQGRSFH